MPLAVGRQLVVLRAKQSRVAYAGEDAEYSGFLRFSLPSCPIHLVDDEDWESIPKSRPSQGTAEGHLRAGIPASCITGAT